MYDTSISINNSERPTLYNSTGMSQYYNTTVHTKATSKAKPKRRRNLAWMYLPKRLELSFRTVRALPNASKIGLDSNTCCSIVPSSVEPVRLPRMARYFMMILHVSVFPAPDSPLTRMDCARNPYARVVYKRDTKKAGRVKSQEAKLPEGKK